MTALKEKMQSHMRLKPHRLHTLEQIMGTLLREEQPLRFNPHPNDKTCTCPVIQRGSSQDRPSWSGQASPVKKSLDDIMKLLHIWLPGEKAGRSHTSHRTGRGPLSSKLSAKHSP